MKKKEMKDKRITTKNLVQVGMLAAVATVLMLFQLPVPFAPAFYQLDLSEVPVIIGAFAMGPMYGALIEMIKILINLFIDGTATAGIGEVANFIIGCALCMPAAWIYKYKKTKKNAIIGLGIGIVTMTVVACLLNSYVLLPVYAKVFYMPLEGLVEMGTIINPNINSLWTFIILAVAPFNLLKGVIVSTIVLISYKKLKKLL